MKDTDLNGSNYITSCSYDCGARCMLKVHVKNNRVDKISTESFKELQIKACPRGLAQGAVVSNPERLMYPLKQTGQRGSGDFVQISWDEALDTISSELIRIRDTYGSDSVYFTPGSGSFTALNNSYNVPRRFFSLFGECTTTWGSASFEGALKSSKATYGGYLTGNSRDNFLYSKLIILWGWNPVVTRFGPDTVYYLNEAKRKGVKIISVDPRKNHTANALDAQWVPVRPGTDTAMLSAMAHVIITEELYDRDFIERYTKGFDEFSDYILGNEDGIAKTPVWAEEICGTQADAIIDLARKYARLKPAALMPGWAPGRSAFGEQFHRGTAVLAAITGNWGIQGGYASGGGDIVPKGLILSGIPVPKTKHHRVHVTKVYDAMVMGKAGGYPADCKILYIVGSNMLNQNPNLNKGLKAFNVPDLVVVHDLFMTPTARFADIVLPVTHFLEQEDVIQPYIGG